MPGALLALAGVTKAYVGHAVVDGVSLTVAPGELLTLLGPSGCGKTTILRMVAGFVAPTGGAITLDGREITRVPPNLRETGMVFQNYALFPHMRVVDNVAFGLRMRGIGRAEVRRRVGEALALVRLERFESYYPHELSGGQQQRAALARALVVEPKVLLLDEPFGALDKKLREQMQVELRKLQQTLGITTVFVTHDQQEALTLSDRIAVLREGRIEQVDRPLALYDRPRTRFVAEFMGVPNFLPGTVVSDGPDGVMVSIPPGVVVPFPTAYRVKPGERITVAVRPESLKIHAGELRGTPGLPGVVAFVTNLGAKVVYEVRLTDGSILTVDEQRLDKVRLHSIGQEVSLALQGDQCVVLAE